MHEFSLINNLLQKIETIAEQNSAGTVTKVSVTIGALAHISASHFREHFVEGCKGSIANGAILEIEENPDVTDPNAQDILLKAIDVE
ncbi:hydrogenase/urease maturation nickel metallochaperone HypA [Pseudomonadota bacterium]